MIVHSTRVSHRQFSYDAKTRRFTAELSDLGRGFGRVYDDASDEGFTIVGKTGREVAFAVTRIKRDSEGDLLYWDLAPADHRERALGVTVRIYND
jgi:hypothetical protein